MDADVTATLAAALEPVISALAADDYQASIVTDGAGPARLVIVAGQSACAECLAPAEVIQSLLDQLLGERDLPAGCIQLVYPAGH